MNSDEPCGSGAFGTGESVVLGWFGATPRVARDLVARPELPRLDEPSEGLAPVIVEQIADVIRAVRDEGMSVLLVKQRLGLCLALDDRVNVLETRGSWSRGRRPSSWLFLRSAISTSLWRWTGDGRRTEARPVAHRRRLPHRRRAPAWGRLDRGAPEEDRGRWALGAGGDRPQARGIPALGQSAFPAETAA